MSGYKGPPLYNSMYLTTLIPCKFNSYTMLPNQNIVGNVLIDYHFHPFYKVSSKSVAVLKFIYTSIHISNKLPFTDCS